MTEEAQRIAIAEACGAVKDDCLWKYPGRPISLAAHELPDFVHDLNAMHEAEKSLDFYQTTKYAETLVDVIRIPPSFYGTARAAFLTLHGTSEQRAEAFLRTIGKWTEEPV